MKTSKIKEIANILIFIKDIKKMELAEKLSFSYTALNNFLVRNSKMLFNHIEEIFNALDFPLSEALLLSEQEHKDKKELILDILVTMVKEQQ